MRLPQLFPLVSLIVTVASYPSPSFQERCAALADSIELDQPFAINVAQYLPPNATIDYNAEGLNETCADTIAYPIPVGVCRLNLRVATSERSELYMEVWLPEQWEGRLLTTGNGGLAGCIQYPELAFGASSGFAAFGTNAGHNGTSGGAFYQQPEVLEDFVWRAVYNGAHIGKTISKQFYSKDCGKSYYLGCSQGGRQGFKAVQEYPELFDGVIAGAPAIDLMASIAWFGYAYETLGFNANSSLISAEQWLAVEAEVLHQCDALDGATDNILEDPTACKFDWTPLLWPSSNSSSPCLTPTQASSVAKLFAPITYANTTLHPGHFHGYEPSLLTILYSPLVSTWLAEAFRYIIYQNLTWDPTTFTLADAYTAYTLNPSNANTFDADLSAFRARGGKMLHWHGTADPLLSASVSELYYNNVRSAMDASVEELDEFYRYFRAGGVAHCSGGLGASFMGQLGGMAVSESPEDNMLRRIVAWVEQGEAPEFVRGTKFVNESVEIGVEFTRRHCKYPRVNKYVGEGDGTDEEGWVCVEPET
ncbi:tannase and feruloyl esterase [Lentithecium fluviatile CBS 122367]|uniref:Carboxylic ester hydrolase n=1 Tax=Lentithecium fluviatile CBS 122367 TaxID=1168545 RepID=A0A6G1J3P1_9PLEO|nr:tannase and feruloyl esterase [Lentithecium fluviatile CBS 122367]